METLHVMSWWRTAGWQWGILLALVFQQNAATCRIESQSQALLQWGVGLSWQMASVCLAQQMDPNQVQMPYRYSFHSWSASFIRLSSATYVLYVIVSKALFLLECWDLPIFIKGSSDWCDCLATSTCTGTHTHTQWHIDMDRSNSEIRKLSWEKPWNHWMFGIGQWC